MNDEMTRKQFASILALFEVYFGKPMDKDRMTLYFELLKDIPHDVLQAAVKKLLTERVYPTVPTVGEIRLAVADLRTGSVMPALQAWGIVSAAARKFGDQVVYIDKENPSIKYYSAGSDRRRVDSFEEAMKSMPDEVAPFVRSLGREYWRALCAGDDSDSYGQHRFEKAWENWIGRKREENLALPEVKMMMDKFGASMTPHYLEDRHERRDDESVSAKNKEK